jgi:hypothetical protein
MEDLGGGRILYRPTGEVVGGWRDFAVGFWGACFVRVDLVMKTRDDSTLLVNVRTWNPVSE